MTMLYSVNPASWQPRHLRSLGSAPCSTIHRTRPRFMPWNSYRYSWPSSWQPSCAGRRLFHTDVRHHARGPRPIPDDYLAGMIPETVTVRYLLPTVSSAFRGPCLHVSGVAESTPERHRRGGLSVP
jgi:hypothetical protein